MICFKCKKDLSVEELAKKIRCDNCVASFCQSCADINSTEVRVMQLTGKRKLEYKCTTCSSEKKYVRGDNFKEMEECLLEEIKKISVNLTKKLEELVDTKIKKLQGFIQDNVLAEVNEIKSCQNEIKTTIEATKSLEVKPKGKSYSEAAREVVVIRPKSKQESTTTRKDVQKCIKPSDLAVGIKNVRDAKEGGIVIECRSEEEVEKLKKVAEQKLQEYKVNIPNRKNPCVKIIGIEDNYTTDELKQMIIIQNDCLMHDKLEIEVKVVKKMKNMYMAIVECDPITFNKLIEQKKLSIGWCHCSVFEYVRVLRCFKCGGFSHLAKNCEVDEKCFNCVGDHKTKDCKAKDFSCRNCIEANAHNQDLKLNVTHYIFDQSCSVLQRKISVEK